MIKIETPNHAGRRNAWGQLGPMPIVREGEMTTGKGAGERKKVIKTP